MFIDLELDFCIQVAVKIVIAEGGETQLGSEWQRCISEEQMAATINLQQERVAQRNAHLSKSRIVQIGTSTYGQ